MRTRFGRFFIAMLMALMISTVPHVVFAEVAKDISGEMIPTMNVVDSLSRAQAEATVRSYLGRQDVQKQLSQIGLSSGEISKRLASLSDAEVKQMANQMNQARYGGDVIGILVVVLLVVVIIYFVKRV